MLNGVWKMNMMLMLVYQIVKYCLTSVSTKNPNFLNFSLSILFSYIPGVLFFCEYPLLSFPIHTSYELKKEKKKESTA